MEERFDDGLQQGMQKKVDELIQKWKSKGLTDEQIKALLDD